MIQSRTSWISACVVHTDGSGIRQLGSNFVPVPIHQVPETTVPR